MGDTVKMKHTQIFELNKIDEKFAKLKKQVEAGNSCSIFGVQNSMRSAICEFLQKKIVYLASDQVRAEQIKSDFEVMGKKAVALTCPSDTFLFKRAESTELFERRTSAMFDIVCGDYDVAVIPVNALISILPKKQKFEQSIIELYAGLNLEIEELEKKLIFAGYRREELIDGRGQFSRHGEVVDIFPCNMDEPIRIDYFDTEIESIKILDLQTAKGTKDINSVKISPHSDLCLESEELTKIILKLEGRKPNSNDNESVALSAKIDEVCLRVRLGERGYALSALLGVSAENSSILEYFDNKETLLVIDECKQVYDMLGVAYKDTSARIKELVTEKFTPLEVNESIFSQKKILDQIRSFVAVAFLKITNSNRFFDSDAVFNFDTKPAARYTHSLSGFYSDTRAMLSSGYKVFIFAGSKDGAKETKKMLSSHGIDLKILPSSASIASESGIFESGYFQGFILSEQKIAVVGTYDIFAKKRKQARLSASRENVFSIPKVGDFVVHHYHGIGVCEGVTRLTGTLGTQDYVVIRYRDDDKLYVPTSHMDMLDRFSGAEKPARLSKIGGQDFAAVKKKVGESVKKLAINLLELYAKREKIKGHAFAPDNELMQEFDNSFGFAETEDQLSSESEIKKDMESGKVMDRLLCGDVGFGKTEVALRACFKAICDGKQVAFVAPTTILSEQHYNTAKSRMSDFGVKIEVLNRFKTQKETAKILSDIKSGKVDLVCGTHRIFSSDVEFKSLGLIILDEEQKFGVEDKEKLKNKYPDVDVLTLSATPIPRTLNMALTGIRDISVISTPPSERLPVQTFVVEYSDALLKDAIMREVSREGQVFVLYNSVEKIYTFAERLRRIVPDVKITVGHGQMRPRELENVIYDFYHKKSDVLVSTTIIENGIDIENANTLIIIDSDKFGLSSLYQLRGRVGRGSRAAYAYFTYDNGKVLTEEAYKRLDAMSEFCEFGSGFKLAMRDLEIRGGGNILGAEQSGHLQKIGFDMYSKLLADAVKELRGEKVEEQVDVMVKVKLDAFVPESYIASSENRMLAYKRISGTDSEELAQKLMLELSEAYGAVPTVVKNLILISLIRQQAGKVGAVEVAGDETNVSLIFKDKSQITHNSNIAEAVFKFRGNSVIDMNLRPLIKISGGKSCYENLQLLSKFLIYLIQLEQKQS